MNSYLLRTAAFAVLVAIAPLRAPAQTDIDHVFAATEVEDAPETIKVTQPAYPESLQGSGKSGMVAVSVVLDQMGDIEDIQVLKSSSPEFAAAALDCVRRWRFLPAHHQGRNVKVRLTIPVRFDSPAKAP